MMSWITQVRTWHVFVVVFFVTDFTPMPWHFTWTCLRLGHIYLLNWVQLPSMSLFLNMNVVLQKKLDIFRLSKETGIDICTWKLLMLLTSFWGIVWQLSGVKVECSFRLTFLVIFQRIHLALIDTITFVKVGQKSNMRQHRTGFYRDKSS